MNNSKNTSNRFNEMWQFIESYLPNYYFRDDVLQDDILYRYLEGDDVCNEDINWIKTEFDEDKNLVKDEIIKLETCFMKESLEAYYDTLFAS